MTAQNVDGVPHYVFLKFGGVGPAVTESDSVQINTVALKATQVSISTQKAVPSFPVPFSGLVTGESVNVAANLGMATKRIDVSGFITDQSITRKFKDTDLSAFQVSGSPATIADMSPAFLTGSGSTGTSVSASISLTAHEIAQLLHSATDASTLQPLQNLNELIILMPSKVNSRYQYRNSSQTSVDVPFTFSARGGPDSLDNDNVAVATAFPDDLTATGIKGFISSFSTTFEEQTVEIGFSLSFEVAQVL